MDVVGMFAYSSIDDLIIGASDNSDITNLNGLSTVGSISGYVKVYNNPNLGSLRGLENLQSCQILSVLKKFKLKFVTGIEWAERVKTNDHF